MRLTLYAIVGMLALATVPAVATATLSHDDCGTSWKTIGSGTASVEIWRGTCTGAVVWSPQLVTCADVFHEHVAIVHVLVLYDGGCQTGALVGPAI